MNYLRRIRKLIANVNRSILNPARKYKLVDFRHERNDRGYSWQELSNGEVVAEEWFPLGETEFVLKRGDNLRFELYSAEVEPTEAAGLHIRLYFNEAPRLLPRTPKELYNCLSSARSPVAPILGRGPNPNQIYVYGVSASISWLNLTDPWLGFVLDELSKAHDRLIERLTHGRGDDYWSEQF